MADPTQPTAPAAPLPGTPEHEEAMAKKFEDAQQKPAEGQPPAPSNDRPQWLPEKFKSPEDLAKAYQELEKKLGQPPQATPSDPPKDPQQGGLKLDQQQAADAAQKAGFDMAALQAEFADNGDLKPETYAKLEEAGIPKPMVEAYIEGQKALAAQFESQVYASVGGKETFDKLQQWANTALSAEERAAYNAAVDSGNLEVVKLATAGLKTRFDATYGTQGATQVQGGSAPAQDVYESKAQMIADMRNPLYAKDPAFRAKVEAKVDRSTNLFPVQRM